MSLPQTLSTDGLFAVLEASAEAVFVLDRSFKVIFANPVALRHADLVDLNARDAMPRGGTLTVSTSNVRLDDAFALQNGVEPGSYVALAVSDSGVGIDAATRARIFEPFFTTKELGRGTGLGLSTVYGIVQQSGGAAVVESEPGAGTCFTVFLPRCSAPTSRAESPDARSGAARGAEVVLLVEDEADLRKLSRRVLERHGHAVLEACDGRDALRVASSHDGKLDVLLTDVVMPGLGGREVHALLAAGRPSMRVLFVSGYTDDEILRRGLLNAGSVLLQKPFTPGELAEAVRAVLDGEPLRQG